MIKGHAEDPESCGPSLSDRNLIHIFLVNLSSNEDIVKLWIFCLRILTQGIGVPVGWCLGG